jgi:hypothetical protein
MRRRAVMGREGAHFMDPKANTAVRGTELA